MSITAYWLDWKIFAWGYVDTLIREGASLPMLFQFAERCYNPAKTKLQLLDWVLFNCLIFNFDAHAKNIRHSMALLTLLCILVMRLMVVAFMLISER